MDDTKIYICPLKRNSPESEIRAKSVIEGVFEVNGHLVMAGMSGNEGVQLTKKDINTYYDMLETMEINK